uniref:Uncharacterized protein n=1 Tax=Wuchereria bancrofti TaxID=6293 RepID=A0AAF5Q671_WUCBA
MSMNIGVGGNESVYACVSVSVCMRCEDSPCRTHTHARTYAHKFQKSFDAASVVEQRTLRTSTRTHSADRRTHPRRLPDESCVKGRQYHAHCCAHSTQLPLRVLLRWSPHHCPLRQGTPCTRCCGLFSFTGASFGRAGLPL